MDLIRQKTFSFLIKEEIMNKKYIKEDQKVLLFGFFSCGDFNNENIYVTINSKEVFEFIKNLLIKHNFEFANDKKNQFLVKQSVFNFKEIKKDNNFFAGCFLNGGSISSIDSVSYHLEIKFFNEQFANLMINIFEKFDIFFKIIQRKSSFVLYLKKIENICDFLKAIEVYQAYLDFEEAKIERDFNNNINRITNFDFYNQKRIAEVNNRFLNNYKLIIEKQMTELFSQAELTFFELKKENLDLSLIELANLMLSKKIYRSKSSLNRYLLKLENIVKKLTS